MNAKEYLNQVGIIEARLQQIDANIDRIRKELQALDNISLPSSWGDGLPHGKKISDPTGAKAVQLAGQNDKQKEKLRQDLLQYEYDDIITRSKLWEKRMEVIETLAKILEAEDPMSKVYHRLLTLKYIEGYSWEAVAVDIGYTWRHTIRLHGAALMKLEGVIKC